MNVKEIYSAFNDFYQKIEQYCHSAAITSETNHEFSINKLDEKIDAIFDNILNGRDISVALFLDRYSNVFKIVWLNFFSSKMSKYWFSSFNEGKITFKKKTDNTESYFAGLHDSTGNNFGKSVLLCFDEDYSKIVLSSSLLLQKQRMSGEVFMLYKEGASTNFINVYEKDRIPNTLTPATDYNRAIYQNYFNNANPCEVSSNIVLDDSADKKKYLTWKYWVNNYAPNSFWTHVFYIDSLRIGALSNIDDNILRNHESISVNFAICAKDSNYDFAAMNTFISLLRNLLNLISNLYLLTIYRKDILKKSLNSALAAIMARNMSHNIGSHILVRLTQEALSGNIDYGRDAAAADAKQVFDPMGLVIEDAYNALGEASKLDEANNPQGILGENQFLRHRIGAAIHYLEAVHDQVNPNVSPGKSRQEALAQDVRVLSAYVQQRMDFIAQICTDWAQWTTTSCLCHDVMALFFQQSKVLEHIAASENLTAARFGRDGKLLAPPKKKGRIKFVIRYKKPTDTDFKVILNFRDTGKKPVVAPDRIPVSFPGGRIGWQAFYVIIEGVIRNFAKHSYKSDTKHKDLQIVVDVIDENGDVEVKVDGQDKPVNKPAYTVRIYSNVSIDEKNTDSKKVSETLQGNLGDSFIKSDGELNKQNLGLAEIRASVGYLQQASIMDIGENKLDEITHDRKIVNVKSCAETSPPLHNFGDEKTRFYYEFRLLKPQIIGIETSTDKVQALKEVTRKQREAEGWHVFDPRENKGISRSFDYYVVDGREETGTDLGKALVEFLKIEGKINSGKYQKEDDVIADLEKFPGRLFLIYTGAKNVLKSRAVQHKQLLRVCVLHEKDYTRLRHGYYEFNEEKLSEFNVNGKFSFTEDEIAILRAEQHATDAAVLFLQRNWLKNWLKYRVDEARTPIKLSLYHYLNEGESSGGETPYIPDTTPYLPEKTQEGENPIEILDVKKEGSKEYALVFGRHFGALNSRSDSLEFRTEGRGIETDYTGKVNIYGESMSGASSYFAFAQDAFKQGKETRDLLSLAEAALMRVVIIDERLQEGFNKASKSTLVSTAEQQVFIGYLESVKNNQDEFSQKPPSKAMMESGYVAVDVKPDFNKTCPKFKINVQLKRAQTCNVSNISKFLWQPKGKFSPDILIIHQGILDHWVPLCGISDEDALNWCKTKDDKDPAKAKIALLIEALKEEIPFVVITSGRGRPTQTPKDCIFLPLSSFDSAPRGCMYEKFPLVQQVLSVVEV